MFSSNRDNIEELHGDIAALKVTLALRDKEIERLTQPVGVEPLEVDGAGKYYYPLSGIPYDGKHYSTDAVARLIAERDRWHKRALARETQRDRERENYAEACKERDALQKQVKTLRDAILCLSKDELTFKLRQALAATEPKEKP